MSDGELSKEEIAALLTATNVDSEIGPKLSQDELNKLLATITKDPNTGKTEILSQADINKLLAALKADELP
jgi:hypothetical protein